LATSHPIAHGRKELGRQAMRRMLKVIGLVLLKKPNEDTGLFFALPHPPPVCTSNKVVFNQSRRPVKATKPIDKEGGNKAEYAKQS
jgi:hypothetical protein